MILEKIHLKKKKLLLLYTYKIKRWKKRKLNYSVYFGRSGFNSARLELVYALIHQTLENYPPVFFVSDVISVGYLNHGVCSDCESSLLT